MSLDEMLQHTWITTERQNTYINSSGNLKRYNAMRKFRRVANVVKVSAGLLKKASSEDV
jgi:hypothetical protein